jgi:Zn-dependent alcohol dehydrogenase
VRGVVVRDGQLSLVDDLVVRDPGRGEVRVTVTASGLCRSDLLLIEFTGPRPAAWGTRRQESSARSEAKCGA